jgi:NAD+ synthase (glutamine-hydrolysing)
MVMKICMAQINTLVGDIAGNARRILEVSVAQRDQGATIVVFPELTLTGYPPEDLLLRHDLMVRTDAAVTRLCEQLPAELAVVIGYPKLRGETLFNSAGVIYQGL